uniref:Uncharacterized protein n=1 Tax=Pavo cristatus TaxID=9049 RepID=A0A8C9G5Y7_PAVCR
MHTDATASHSTSGRTPVGSFCQITMLLLFIFTFLISICFVLFCFFSSSCPFSNKLCHNGWVWDSDKCECVADVQHSNRREGLPPLAELAMCGQYMEFDEENCECICRQKCPTDFFQSKENCSCYLCRESQESCAQKHKIFHAETCSCEDRCPSQPRTCPTAKPTCPRHCRCPKEKRNSHGSQSKENP